MNHEMREILKKLTETAGLPGMESAVRERIAEEVIEVSHSVKEDVLGNLIVKAGAEQGYKLGIFAHMDEVGLIVRRISPTGLIFFDLLGSIDDRILLGSEVDVITVEGKAIRGVIGNKSRHLQSTSDLRSEVNYKHMVIDIGATDAQEVVKLGIEIGCGVVFTTACRFYDNGTVLAKALDDRIGCTVLIEAVKRVNCRLKNTTIYGIFTCQEEIGAKGAKTAAFDYGLDLCITLDTVPVQNADQVMPGEVNLNNGPVIRLFDWQPTVKLGMCSNRDITNRLREVAQEYNIPHQVDVLTSTYLDSANAHLTGGGVPGASICFPRRYAHTAVEMSNMSDIENALELLCQFIFSLDTKPLKFGKTYK